MSHDLFIQKFFYNIICFWLKHTYMLHKNKNVIVQLSFLLLPPKFSHVVLFGVNMLFLLSFYIVYSLSLQQTKFYLYFRIQLMHHLLHKAFPNFLISSQSILCWLVA